jgi:hypothetical protein
LLQKGFEHLRLLLHDLAQLLEVSIVPKPLKVSKALGLATRASSGSGSGSSGGTRTRSGSAARP